VLITKYWYWAKIFFFTKTKSKKMMFNTGLTATYVDFGKGVFIGSGVIICSNRTLVITGKFNF
jgi:hypothetical protein